VNDRVQFYIERDAMQDFVTFSTHSKVKKMKSLLFLYTEDRDETFPKLLLLMKNNIFENICDETIYGAKSSKILRNNLFLLYLNKNGDTPLSISTYYGTIENVRLLLNKRDTKKYINFPNQYGERPLHRAIRRGDIEFVKLLLSNGANVNLFAHNGETPLYDAIRNDRIDIVELLLKYEINVNTINKNKETPLHIAILFDRFDISRLLLNKNANVNLKDKNGNTAFHVAISWDRNDTVKLLLSNGADVNSLQHDGMSPLHIAALNKNFSHIIQLLKVCADINIGTPNRIKVKDILKEYLYDHSQNEDLFYLSSIIGNIE